MALLDHRGRPIDTGALKRDIIDEELARSGGARNFAGEHPSIGLDPGKLGSVLRSAEDGDPRSYFALAEDMEEKDLHYLSVLGTRKRQVSQLQITVEPASESADDKANADLVRRAIKRFDEGTIFDMLDAVGKGISLLEIVWKLDAREWMPSHFCWVNPLHLDFDDATRGEPMLKTVQGKVALPPAKFITLTLKAKSGIPVRGGLARAAAWCWMFKNYTIKDWIRFSEAYGQPLRVGKFHAGASDAEKRALLRSLAALGSDAAAIVPQAMSVEFVESKNTGSAAGLFQGQAEYFDKQISKAVLGQTATTDAVTGGLGSGKEHNEVREDIERADAGAVARALMLDLAKPLIDLNRGEPKEYPVIKVGRPEKADAQLMIQAAKDLVPLGWKISQAEIRSIVGTKEPEPDEDLLVPPGQVQSADPADPQNDPGRKMPPGRVSPPGRLPLGTASARPIPYGPYSALKSKSGADPGSRFALAASEGDGTDAIGALADQLIRETADPQDAMIRRLRDLIDDPSVTSLEDLGRRLLALEPELTSPALATALGDAMMLAELVGRDELAGGP